MKILNNAGMCQSSVGLIFGPEKVPRTMLYDMYYINTISFVMGQHCFALFWRHTNTNISLEFGAQFLGELFELAYSMIIACHFQEILDVIKERGPIFSEHQYSNLIALAHRSQRGAKEEDLELIQMKLKDILTQVLLLSNQSWTASRTVIYKGLSWWLLGDMHPAHFFNSWRQFEIFVFLPLFGTNWNFAVNGLICCVLLSSL